MADAPEKIWATQVHTTSIWAQRAVGTWDERRETGGTPYIRADLVDDLRKALEFYANRTTYVSRIGMESPITQDNFGDMAKTALARIAALKEK